jgi:type VI secretion system protein ImpF
MLPSERLQPCLLDRLTDDEPHRQREGRGQRVISMSAYRAAVLRDLAWLLNTRDLSGAVDLSALEEVRRSVVNFGMPDLCGRTVSGLDPLDVEKSLLDTIKNYEPRILPHTLSIRPVSEPEALGGGVSVSFEVEGELWAEPIPEALFIRTELDLETGDFVVGGRSQ